MNGMSVLSGEGTASAGCGANHSSIAPCPSSGGSTPASRPS